MTTTPSPEPTRAPGGLILILGWVQPPQGHQQPPGRTPVLKPSSNSTVPVTWFIKPATDFRLEHHVFSPKLFSAFDRFVIGSTKFQKFLGNFSGRLNHYWCADINFQIPPPIHSKHASKSQTKKGSRIFSIRTYLWFFN